MFFPSRTKLVPKAKAGIWSTSRENVLLHCGKFSIYFNKSTARKVSVFGVILVRIFSHLDWISLCIQNAGKYGPEKLRIGHFLRSEGLSDEGTLLVLGNNKFMIQSLAFQDKLLSIAFFISDINLAWSKKHVNLNHNHVVWQLKFRIASTALGVF